MERNVPHPVLSGAAISIRSITGRRGIDLAEAVDLGPVFVVLLAQPQGQVALDLALGCAVILRPPTRVAGS